MPIPDKLHFVWIGNPIPHRQAACILSWAVNNPGHSITLWTNNVRQNALNILNIARIHQTLCANPTYGVVNRIDYPGGRYVEFYKVIGGQNVMIETRDVTFLNAGLQQKQLDNRYHNELLHRNYGAASDILRVILLEQEGGIYLDCDSDPKAPLPHNLNADDHILFGTVRMFGAPSLCNAVIAAPQGHAYLTDLANNISNS